MPDFSKLDPTVVQLPPFEVLGGTHAADLMTPGKRFFQYDYRLRLMSEDLFGGDVPIPPLEIAYRIESQVTGGETVAGTRADLLAAAHVGPADLDRARRYERHSRSAGGGVHAHRGS